jgi:hypothetical protein
MRIKDGLELPGWAVEIPDCTREDLPEFFKDMGYKVGAEIGVWKGEFTQSLCRSGSKIYGIDSWVTYDDCDYYGQKTGGSLEFAYDEAKERLEPLGVTLIRKFSLDAVKDFRDGSLDWVYIDANHAFPYVAMDIYKWNKKIRVGGVIAGHDYIHIISKKDPLMCTVPYAVNAFTRAARIKKWYIVGEKFPKPGHQRDRLRSWFWIKEGQY